MRRRILKEIAWGNAFWVTMVLLAAGGTAASLLLSLEPVVTVLLVLLVAALLLGAWGCWGLPSMHHEIIAKDLQGLLQAHEAGEDIRDTPVARKYLSGPGRNRINTQGMRKDLARHTRMAKENRLFIRLRRRI